MQWAKEKGQTSMQNNTQKTKDRARRTSQKTCSIFGTAIAAATIRLLFSEIHMLPTMDTGQALRIVTR